MKVNIIDPSSTEFNRGSFCYAPYLLYNGFSTNDCVSNVQLYETFKPEDIDTIQDADCHIVTLWSYPQIEACLLLAQFLPFAFGKENVYFAGYSPLIEHLGLPHVSRIMGRDPLADSAFLLLAMRNYPSAYEKFDRLLLSDCDMHIKELEKGNPVFPLFTSYGCPNRCAFCPSTKNCNHQRTVMDLEDVLCMLNQCITKGVKNIHFTDEDFFFNADRAFEILKHLALKGMHLIALASSHTFLRFLEKYGGAVLKDAGMDVVEIGFESGDSVVSDSMGAGKSLTKCQQLARLQPEIHSRIFWLCLTFFPGETVTSLNETGEFMRRYGMEMDEVVGRLRTNGTKGGLGQFFQPYHGLGIHAGLQRNGLFLTTRPMRLLPSYLPNSFLNYEIKKLNKRRMVEAEPWLGLYGVGVPEGLGYANEFVYDHIFGKPRWQQMKNAVALAILARMGGIE